MLRAGGTRSRRARRAGAALATAATLACGACGSPVSRAAGRPARPSTAPASSPTPAPIPAYRHIVVVIEENKSYQQIIGSPSAPYINSLAEQSALFTNSHAITHPSEPNYLALFGGSTFGVTADTCPVVLHAPSLASELLAAHRTYGSYSESMPAQGYRGCASGDYARKHNPAADFASLPPSANKTLAQFPARYASLPTVSFVDPNLLDDMHSASVSRGDAWLRQHLGRYVTWAKAHDSLLIVTWDENDGSPGDQIATMFVGAHIRPGRYGAYIDDYSVLRTIEQAYGLAHAGFSASTPPVTGVFGG